MAYTKDDIKRIRDRISTKKRDDNSSSLSSDDSVNRVRSIKESIAPSRPKTVYDDYARMATQSPVENPSAPSFRYNSYSEYENAINAVKPTGLDNVGYRAKGLWNSIADINRALPSLTPKWRDSVNQRKEYTDEEQEYADLTKEFELYKQDRGNVFREYNDRYKNNSDFAEKSQTLPAAINAATIDTLGKMSGDVDTTNRIAAYNNMSDDEKALANYLANTDLKAFWKYMSDMNAIEDKEIYEQGLQIKEAAINKEPLIGAYYTAEGMANKIANAPAIPFEYAFNAATGARQNPYSGAAGYANMGWDEQQLVSEKIREKTGSDVLPFLYNTGVSIGESLLGAGTFGEGYSVLMGTSAFNNSYKELEERGASDTEIMTGALLAGAAETVFEKISLENLLSPKDITSFPTLIRETLKQAGVEGSEELFTELSNIITDEISQGANSEINKMINEMRGNGVSEDEIKKTISDYIGRRIVESTLGGMLSGGAMGGVYSGANYAYNTEIGRNTNRAELASAIENMDRRSKTRRAYENAGRNLDNMKDAEIGAMAINALNEASSLDRDAYGNALVDNLVAAGLSKKDASKIKDAYFKQKRSKVEEGYFNNSDVAEAVEKTWNEKGVELLNKANENAKRISRTVTNKTGVAKLLKKSDLKVGARTELNGEKVKVKDVIKDGDTIKVVTENGEVNPKDLTLSANDAAMVVAASGIDNEVKRQAYFANYDGVQNVAEYTESFDTAYRYGRLGMSEEQLTEDLGKSIHLTAEQAVNAFVKGQNEANTTSEKLDESLKNATKELEGFRKGKLTFDNVDVKSLNATQRGATTLAEMFNAMGLNVVLFNDSSDDSENGRYENGTVYINLSARYYKNAIKFDKGYVINTMAHELTHWMEDTAKTEFNALKKAIFDFYGEEKTKELIAKEQQRQKGLSDPAAESEVVARACEDMLSNPDTLEKIMMGIDTNTRQTIIDKFKEFFEKLGRFLKNALSMNSQSDAARMLRENAEVFEQVRQQWIKTFTEAVNTVQKIEQAYDDVTEDYTEETHPKFSDKVTVESTEHLMAIHNIGEKQLLKTISMGGFACPSIAILKQYMPHNEFGDISIVFPKATINPKLRWNSVFSGDAYTPIFPTVEKKLSRDKQYAIEEKIRNLVGGDEMFRIIGSPSLDYDNMTDKLNRFETAADAYRYTDELKYAYLKDIGKDVSIPTKDYVYMPNEISNDAIGAIALVLGKDTVKEMYEGGSTWYNNHPEEVDKLRLRLNEAFIKEHNAEDYKSTSLKELYRNYFNDEDGKLSFRNYDTAVRAMYAMTTSGAKQVKDSVALKKMLDENVEQEAFDKWLNDLFEGVVEKEGFRNDVDLFTASGKRRSWEALHDEITLENVVKYMRKQEPSGIGMMGANIFGGATKKYASIEDMRKDIARLMLIAKDEMDKKRTEISNKTHDLIYEVVGNTGDAFSLSMRHDDVYKMFVEAIRKYRTVEGINSYLHKEGDGYYNITDDVAPKLLEIVKEIEQLPTGYFEAKPLRGVSLDEIAYVVIPDNASQDLINALDENGIQHYTYDHESEDNRVEVTNEHADVESGTLFSSKVDSEGNELTEEQQKFFAESKIVDDNGNLLVMYHGTDSYDNFTVFKAGKNGYLGKGMYFTEKDYIAKKYAEQNGYDGRIYKVYLNVTNPLIVTSDNPALEILGEKVAARRAQKNSYSTRWLTPADIKKLQDKGYDGIVWKYGKSPIEVSVWDSNQVKLTTNENPTANPDIRYSLKDIGYHAGDLGKSESLGQQGFGRRTGHFGTGTYFVGDESEISYGTYGKRPHETVDFSKYNLYKPYDYKTGMEVHDFLKYVDGGIKEEWLPALFEGKYSYIDRFKYFKSILDKDPEDFNPNWEDEHIKAWQTLADNNDIEYQDLQTYINNGGFSDDDIGDAKSWYLDYLKEHIGGTIDGLNEAYHAFEERLFPLTLYRSFKGWEDALKKVVEYQKTARRDDYRADSYATVFMKALGYEGIDVRGIKGLDDTEYGSVIYDLKGEDLERKKEIGTAKFSSKVDDPIFEILGLNKKLEKENKALKADVDALKEYIRLDAELSNGKKWNPVELNSVSKYLADKYNSDTDMIALRKSLATAYTYITEQLSNGNESWEDIMDECYSVATDIYNDIKNKPTISKTRITSEIQKAGIKADADVIKDVQNAVTLATQEEYVRQIAVDIYNGYWRASNLKTQADIKKEATNKLKSDKTKIKQAIEKKDKEIQRLKFEHRKTIDWMLAEQRLADQIHYGKVIEQVREDREKKLSELKQFVKDRDARLKNAAERRRLISKITEVSEDLSKRLLKGEKGKKVPQALKAPLAELLTAIDFSSKQLLGINAIKRAGIETKRDIAMSALLNKVSLALQGFNDAKAEGNDAYELAGLHLPPNYATELQEIADTIAEVEQTAEGSYVLQYMTAEQLDNLYKAIKAIRTAINNVNKIISTNNVHEVDYLGNEIMTYLDKLGQRKIDNAVTQFMDVANKTPYYFFKHMGRGGQEVFSFLQNGWDKLADNVEVIKNFTRGTKKDGSDALYTSQEFEKWKNTVHEFDVLEAPTEEERAEGKEGRQRHITMTEAQIMALYCLSKREHAMGHISRDGIVIDEIKTKKKYGKHEMKRQDAVTLAPTDLEKILSVVTSDARMKQVADKIQEFMNTVCAEWGNEVTMKLYGTEEFTEKNYFPIHVNQEVLSNEAKDKSHSIYGMLNQSFMKPLTENARNEINVSDIFDVFNAHASDMAKYNALALPIMDVIKVWNYKENLDRGDEGQREVKAVKKSITKAIGEKGNSYISGLLRDLNGDAESGRYDKTSMRLVKNYKTAAVAANIQTALLQPLAYIRAGYMVNPKYLRKALTRKPKINECIRDLGVQKWKSMGFYDTNLTRGLDKIISNSDSLFDTIVDKSLWLTEKMDEVTWGYLYVAVELETKDKYPSLSGEKLKEQSIKRLRDVVYGTQVFDSTLARTAMMRSTSALVQMETSFGAEPILSVNMLMDAATEFNQEARRNGLQSAMQKKGRLIARASLVYLISSVVESALRAALKKVRDYDDEDDTFEGITTDILQRTLEELDFLNKIPFVKEAMPYIRKFAYRKLGFEDISKSIYADNTRMDTEVYATIDSAIKSIEKAADGKDLNYKDVQKMAQALSQTTGLPIANVIKEFKVVWNNTIGRATGNTIK